MTINLINRGDLKSHFNESKRKLRLRHPILLLKMISDEMNAFQFLFGVIIPSIVLEKFTKEEQFAIIDHELGHIKRWRDMFLVFYFVAPLVFLAYILVVIFNMGIYFPHLIWIAWPWISTLSFVIFLILRFLFLNYILHQKKESEFRADRISGELGNAKALISVLKKMEEYDRKQPSPRIEKHVGTLIATIYLAKRFTHPSTEERIRKLEELSHFSPYKSI